MGQEAHDRQSGPAAAGDDRCLPLLLAGGTVVARPEEAFEIRRALPHGHVAAVVGMMRKLDLSRLLGRTASRERDLALPMIASRLIASGQKLATLRALAPEAASSILGRELDLGVIEGRENYAALDWLGGQQQDRVGRTLLPAVRQNRHLPRSPRSSGSELPSGAAGFNQVLPLKRAASSEPRVASPAL